MEVSLGKIRVSREWRIIVCMCLRVRINRLKSAVSSKLLPWSKNFLNKNSQAKGRKDSTSPNKYPKHHKIRNHQMCSQLAKLKKRKTIRQTLKVLKNRPNNITIKTNQQRKYLVYRRRQTNPIEYQWSKWSTRIQRATRS